MSSTDAPQCSTMYRTSSAVRRKLIGTTVRPKPLTPQKAVSRRPALGLTIATRSPWPTPIASSASAIPRARRWSWA
jgi:hypothetical protein